MSMLFKKHKLVLLSTFSFLIGCMLTLALIPIDRTCRLENTDREFNIMTDSKLKSPELIVLILSAPDNFSKRNTIRETWLKLKNRARVHVKFKHFFVIGGLGLSVAGNKAVNNEQLKYNDVLILPLYDSYKNLTQKVLKSFEWLQGHYELFDVDFKYVLKCDDDSFVRIDHLMQELAQIELIYLKTDFKDLKLIKDDTSTFLRVNWQVNDVKSADEDLSLYWGYFNGNAKVKSSGKWKESSWMLCDNYLPYALGGGYVLSRRLVGFLGQNADYLRQYHSEDISVGVWLAGVKNVLRVHDTRFDTEWRSRGCQNYYLITHSVTEQQMREFYRNIVERNRLCGKEEIKRRFYRYNWTVSPSQCCNKNI